MPYKDPEPLESHGNRSAALHDDGHQPKTHPANEPFQCVHCRRRA